MRLRLRVRATPRIRPRVNIVCHTTSLRSPHSYPTQTHENRRFHKSISLHTTPSSQIHFSSSYRTPTILNIPASHISNQHPHSKTPRHPHQQTPSTLDKQKDVFQHNNILQLRPQTQRPKHRARTRSTLSQHGAVQYPGDGAV